MFQVITLRPRLPRTARSRDSRQRARAQARCLRRIGSVGTRDFHNRSRTTGPREAPACAAHPSPTARCDKQPISPAHAPG